MPAIELERIVKVLKRGEKYWYRIGNLDDPKERTWFEESEQVYKTLFELECREPFENFRKYISQEMIRDCYYVCLYKERVVGMLFLTIYPDFMFIAYGGVDLRRVGSVIVYKILAAGLFGVVYGYLSDSKCRAALFELERLRSEDITAVFAVVDPVRGREGRDKIANRVQATYCFQEYGAWKIPYIRYVQPVPGSAPATA